MKLSAYKLFSLLIFVFLSPYLAKAANYGRIPAELGDISREKSYFSTVYLTGELTAA